MNTDFFIDLLHQVKEFENSEAYKPHSDVEDFRLWLNDKKYRFFMAGDMQDPGNGVQRWRDTAKEMKKIMDSNPVDFFICIGDMATDDKIENKL